MAQGKATDENVRLLVFSKRAPTVPGQPGKSLDVIYRELNQEGISIGRTTVAEILRDFDALPESVKDADREWRWLKADEYGITWELAGRILGFVKTVPDPSSRSTKLRHVTVRQARWLARTLPITEKLDDHDAFWLNERFVIRERRSDLLGKALDIADLESLFTFRPWVSDSHASAYFDAVAGGLIEPIQNDAVEMMMASLSYSMALGLGPEKKGKTRTYRLHPSDITVHAYAVRWHNEILKMIAKAAGQPQGVSQ